MYCYESMWSNDMSLPLFEPHPFTVSPFLNNNYLQQLTEYNSMSSGAVISFCWFRALNLISLGGKASYTKGPCIVSKSWVPIATSVLFLHMFWWSLSWKESSNGYLLLVWYEVLSKSHIWNKLSTININCTLIII